MAKNIGGKEMNKEKLDRANELDKTIREMEHFVNYFRDGEWQLTSVRCVWWGCERQRTLILPKELHKELIGFISNRLADYRKEFEGYEQGTTR